MKKTNNEEQTAAQILFSNKEILTKRPEDMNFADYRILRNHQTMIINKLFPGPNRIKK
jgi:hypothetical protein